MRPAYGVWGGVGWRKMVNKGFLKVQIVFLPPQTLNMMSQPDSSPPGRALAVWRCREYGLQGIEPGSICVELEVFHLFN